MNGREILGSFARLTETLKGLLLITGLCRQGGSDDHSPTLYNPQYIYLHAAARLSPPALYGSGVGPQENAIPWSPEPPSGR